MDYGLAKKGQPLSPNIVTVIHRYATMEVYNKRTINGVKVEYFNQLTKEQRDLLLKHLDLVIEANNSINLTRIDSVSDGIILHIEDSLLGMSAINEAPSGLYGDLGSGAGFPGIPLAVATGRETVLVDSRAKKVKVLDSFIEELGLTNVSTFAGRAELLAKTQSKRYAVLTARALSQLPVLLELASPLLKHGGRLICYKAHVQEEELANAGRVLPQVGMAFIRDESFLLNGEYTRRILTYEKVAEPVVKLPRQEGMAQKHPLSE